MSLIASIQTNQLLKIVVPRHQKELQIAPRHQEIAKAQIIWASCQTEQSRQASLSTERFWLHHDQDLKHEAHRRSASILQDRKSNTKWSQDTHPNQGQQQQQLEAWMDVVSLSL